MKENERGRNSAAASALGYLYQVKYALFESLCRLRRGMEFVVKIETLDDVTFENEKDALELLQTKHHLNNPADLRDGSSDLWKTLRNWCDAFRDGIIPEGTICVLVTTSNASIGSAAHYLKPGESRNSDSARQRLNTISLTSTNRDNQQAYEAYQALSDDQRKILLENTFVCDAAPDITKLDEELKEIVYGFAPKKSLASFLQRIEGWWYHRTIKHLIDKEASPILSEELDSETARLREQFKEDNLPIDDDIIRESVDATGYQDELFVHQLRFIDIGDARIYHAIKNYFRAFEQRSRWVRETLLLVGELDRYEDRLVEEWDLHFQQMRDKLGEGAAEEAKKTAAQAIYEWVENAAHPPIRPGVNEPCISRGTFQILSNFQRVGWHLEFKERLHELLEKRKVAS